MQELKDWILLTQKRYIIDDTERQWKGLNPNDEPTVSWENYKVVTYGVSFGKLYLKKNVCLDRIGDIFLFILHFIGIHICKLVALLLGIYGI